MTELGPNERRLLRALHAADEPSEADRARVRTRLLVKLGAATGVASAVATAASAASGATTGAGAASVAPGAATTATVGLFAGTWKIGSAIVVVAAAAGGTAWVATGPHASEPATTPHQIARPVHPSSKPAVPEGAQRESSEKATVPAKPARIRSRAAEGERKPGDLEGELSLLENAQEALKVGDSARALEELDRHASEHPGGALATERAGIRAVALCEAGKLSEGRREARRFLSKNPKSPLAVRVKAACLSAKK